MIYQFDSIVRYSEVDMDRNLTLNGILNYFQDCTTFHSESVGLGLDYMEREQKLWVLSFWQIVIHRVPQFGEKITIQTWPYDFKGFLGSRNFTLLDENGEQLVIANSLWSFLDMKTGLPTKMTADQAEGYQLTDKLEMTYAKRKIPVPAQAVRQTPVTITRHQLDTNNHVNNGQYVQLACAFLPDDFQVRQLRVEYKRQAGLDDQLIPWVDNAGGICTVALCDSQKQPYAVIAFDEKV